MPTISIVIPVYNTKKDLLITCLESIISQTYNDIEIILINDGSTTNIGQVCQNYIIKDSRARYYTQENRGVSATRNRGISLATGEWITFVDADDWLEANACQSLLPLINNERDIIIFSLYVNHGSVQYENMFFTHTAINLNEEELEQLQLQMWHSPKMRYSISVAVCKVYRRQFLLENSLQFQSSLVFSEDQLFIFEAMNKTNKIAYLHKALYHYCINKGSATQSFNPNAVSNYNTSYKALHSALKKYNKDTKYYKALELRVITYLFLLCNNYYCHKSNPQKMKIRLLEFDQICLTMPYYTAINNISFKEFKSSNNAFKSSMFFLLKYKFTTLFLLIWSVKNRFTK